MRTLVFLLALLLPHLVAAGSDPCYPVASEWISARDVARAIPEFAQLQPDLAVGYAPIPGTERFLRASDLQAFARQQSLPIVVRKGVCFGWTVAALEKGRMLAAMQTSLAGRQCKIEIVDQNKALVPSGAVFFPLPGLTALSDKPVIWNGYIAYTAGRRFSTWALVRVQLREPHLITLKAIRRGDRIAPNALKSEIYEGPLPREKAAGEIGEDSQAQATRDLPAGTTLLSSMIALPEDVQRDETVLVTVDFSSGHIEAQGVAMQPGSSGDVILVKNPRSGRLFKARVLSKGRVLALPGSLSGLTSGEKQT